MTRDRLNKHWDLIQKFKNGEDIQYENENGEWIDVENPLFHLDGIYRIKPKQEYIPFDYSDAKYLIGKAVMDKYRSHYHLVLYVYAAIGEDLQIELSDINRNISALCLFNDYAFLDGSPCGKLKQ